MQARRQTILSLLLAAGCFSVSVAQINVQAHLDKDRYAAGAPVFVIWEYTNAGSSPVPFVEPDPYCEGASITAPELTLAAPPICPYTGTVLECFSIRRRLKPGEKYIVRYLLNDLFELRKPGTYEITVDPPGLANSTLGNAGQTTLKLVLVPAGERELEDVYRPFIVALNSSDANEQAEAGRSLLGISFADAVRVLADSRLPSAESALLRISSDPLTDNYVQGIADKGLTRLRTPAACARLGELAVHPELHQQQEAIEELGKCGDSRYAMILFQLADNADIVSASRSLALSAAGELGGDWVIDRLLSKASQGSLDRTAALYALGRTGSARAARAIVDMLPSLLGDNRTAALFSLKTLTHQESLAKDFDAQAREWKDWWAGARKKEIYRPRDCQGGIQPLR